ncbi:protocadherin-19-like [Liolophura sinensis]|uniref:protocadherin-19-like n=1 Tax=Liolophura sinensis TaxID=3198878 RepID=UPI0031588BE1
MTGACAEKERRPHSIHISLNADNAVTYYDLESAEGDAVPFSVTDSGDILVFGVIDRELTDVYRLNIFAFDNGNPVRSASTQLGINVLDENDNVAVFTEPRYSALVRANISLGAEFLRVKANDRDFGENGRVLYFIGGANSHPFDIDSHTGGISTSGFLTEQRYSFPVSAKNPNSSTISSAEVIISVIREEELAAIFETDIVTAEIREGQPIGSLVINVLSDIAVLTGDITFEILSDVPFSFNKFTGNIYTRAVLDREARDLYNFTLRALDDTPSGNQVAPPEEVIVLVNVSDINDNPPSFAFPEIKLQVSEDTAVGKIFYTITAKDPDLLTNGDVVRYELLNSTEDGCPFGLNQTQDGAQLYLVKPLDRENLARYYLTVKATDGGLPPQTGSAMLCITVGDTNDNPPWFETQSSTVNISKLLPVNSVVFTAHAVDNDLEGKFDL